MISQISAKARGFFLVVYSMISVLVLMTIVVYIAHYMYGALEDEFSRVEEFGEDVNTRWALFATSATLSLRNPVWGLGEENYNVPGQIALGQNRGPHVWLLELSVCKGVPHSLLALFLVAWVYRVLRRGLSVHHVSSVRYASILIALLLYGLSGGFAGHQSIWSLLGYAFGIAHQPGASNNVAHSRSCGISAVRLLKAQDRAEAPVGRAPGGSE